MNSNLELAIEYFQKIYDDLELEIDKSIAVYDFETAEILKKSFFYARNKLMILKGLRNPNHSRIEQLKRTISSIESGEYQKRFDFPEKNMFPDLRERMIKRFEEKTSKTLFESKEELKLLLKTPLKNSIDNDTLIVLLEDLILDEITKIELEIKNENIYVQLFPVGKLIFLKFITKNSNSIDYYLGPFRIPKLKELGFRFIENDFILKMKMSNLQGIIEVLAIIIFDIFRINSDTKMNVIVHS